MEACNYIVGVMYAFAGYVHNAEDAGYATILHYKIAKDNGHMLIHCTGDVRVEAAYDAAIIGLLQLEQARPQAVKVERRAEI